MSSNFDSFNLEGNLDVQAEGFFRELPSRVHHPVVRFDFSRVRRINSMGVALILRCFKEIKEQKKAQIQLSGLAPMHDMLLKMTGVYLLATPVAEPGREG